MYLDYTNYTTRLDTIPVTSYDNDFVSFRHHTYTSVSHKEVELQEVGPRFEMQLYKLKLGTVDVALCNKYLSSRDLSL
eukprot:SAG25_NODE_314_length_9979_cov_44.448988_10_plen_78_part_00